MVLNDACIQIRVQTNSTMREIKRCTTKKVKIRFWFDGTDPITPKTKKIISLKQTMCNVYIFLEWLAFGTVFAHMFLIFNCYLDNVGILTKFGGRANSII